MVSKPTSDPVVADQFSSRLVLSDAWITLGLFAKTAGRTLQDSSKWIHVIRAVARSTRRPFPALTTTFHCPGLRCFPGWAGNLWSRGTRLMFHPGMYLSVKEIVSSNRIIEIKCALQATNTDSSLEEFRARKRATRCLLSSKERAGDRRRGWTWSVSFLEPDEIHLSLTHTRARSRAHAHTHTHTHTHRVKEHFTGNVRTTRTVEARFSTCWNSSHLPFAKAFLVNETRALYSRNFAHKGYRSARFIRTTWSRYYFKVSTTFRAATPMGRCVCRGFNESVPLSRTAFHRPFSFRRVFECRIFMKPRRDNAHRRRD